VAIETNVECYYECGSVWEIGQEEVQQKTDRAGRPSGSNKLGRGQRKFGRVAAVTPSVPPLCRHMKILAGASESQRGHAWD